MTTCIIQTGEKGIDVGFHYPTGQQILDMGYTYGVGYLSPNASKNIPVERCQDWYDSGLGQYLIWEVNANRTNGGYEAGYDDGIIAAKQAMFRGYPNEVALFMANDTNTTSTNVGKQADYARGFQDGKRVYYVVLGMYDDTDLAAATQDLWNVAWLPNAYSWTAPTKTLAVAKATALGYSFIQGRLSDDPHEPSYDTVGGIAVDINHCIKPCMAWGKPRGQTMDIWTNTEPLAVPGIGGPYSPGVVKLTMEDGRMRHLTETELILKGITNSPSLGTPITNQQVQDLGWYVPYTGGGSSPANPRNITFQGTGVVE